MGPVALLQFAPLLQMDVADLSVEHVQGILDTLNVPGKIDDDLLKAGVALLQDQDIHSVADLIQSPIALQQLSSFFQSSQRESAILDPIFA